MAYDLLKELREKRKTYAEMVEFCTDNLILNNDIIPELSKLDIFAEVYCGSEKTYYNADGDEISENEYYETEGGNEEYDEVYQYFIIDPQGAERFAEYTNELVYYIEQLDLYILGVKHWGTSWDYVSANWKEEDGE